MNDIDRDRLDRHLNLPRPRIYRDRSCPFDTLSDTEFRQRYRFTRHGFHSLVSLMEKDLTRTTNRSRSLSTAQQLALTLRVLASNSFQIHAGDSSGVAQSTTSRVLKDVTMWFVKNVDQFVQWHSPSTQESMQRRVFEKFGLPGVVGMIDGTHVRIIAPAEREDSFVNRKSYHSINVGAIVDDQYKFLWFTAKWPGRSHDSRVWRDSILHTMFQNGTLTGRLVGDSAYKGEPFMLKIFPGTNLPENKAKYNDAICGVRVCVEQAFGQLKRQFHSLHAELRYDPERAAEIITTAICLRNASITLNEPQDFDDPGNCTYDQPDTERLVDNTNGLSTMTTIANNFF